MDPRTTPVLASLNTGLDRRGFLRLATGAGSGLVLALTLPSVAHAQALPGMPPVPPLAPWAFVRIAPDGAITLLSKNPEIGQGIKTAFAMILAEELDANWSDVTVIQSPVDARIYGMQVAGGSNSVFTSWDGLRRAGAGARAMLVAAAAEAWGVPLAEVTAANSRLAHVVSGRSAAFGEMAERAARQKVPDADSLQLKLPAARKLVGTRVSGVDNAAIVTGQPLFGIDMELPGMLVAMFAKPPRAGAEARAANLEEIRALPGVRDCFLLAGGDSNEVCSGVAIVAKNTWSAFSARKKLQVSWDNTAAADESWAQLVEIAWKKAGGAEAQVIRRVGDVDAVFAAGLRTVEARYTFGFVAHATLEPQNCVAWYRREQDGDRLELWAPTQTPGNALGLLSSVMGLPQDRITLHSLRAGGGFGRRLLNDYAVEAARISKHTGVPVKLLYTREDDMQGDYFRPGGFHSLKGALDGKGQLAAWRNDVVSFTADGRTSVPGGGMSPTEFPSAMAPNFLATLHSMRLGVPCGWWRAPGSNTVAWVNQSFLHELSVAAQRDHAEFLLEVMTTDPGTKPSESMPTPGGGTSGAGFSVERAVAVIRLAMEKADWGKALPAGRAQGLAFHHCHRGHFAEIAEVSVSPEKKVVVHRVTVAGDIGSVVNLSGAESQVQGSIVDAIGSMVLEVTVENGAIQQQNFDRYPLPRMPVTPQVDVYFIGGDVQPSGCGEPAFPPLVPAVCNAIYTLTGHRIRTLPITREGFSV